jgi:PAS domain S-box-containing protein
MTQVESQPSVPAGLIEPRNGMPSGISLPLDIRSARSVAELSKRPSRPPDYAAENRAMAALARKMASSPESILQGLADAALTLCRADSAGVSLLEDFDQRSNFHWRAIAGRWAPHLGGGTPRNFGPCGVVLDRNIPLLFSHPEIDFPYFGEVQPLVEDALLIPFHVKGEAVGTIWVVSHVDDHRFDAEDLRVMTNLGNFAATAYQVFLSMTAAARIVALVDSSDDAIVSKDLDGTIASWNAGAERIFGYTAKEAIGKSILMLIPPDRHNEEPMIIEHIRRGERVDHYETIRRRKDGGLIDVSLSVSPIRTAEGGIIGASKIARDITKRKCQERRIATLAREVEHRAKNILATVQATVHLSHSDTPEGLKEVIEGRIKALANANALFEQSHWAGADLRSLVSQELAPYCRNDKTRASIDGPNISLEPNLAQMIAIGLHELATNAVKYGALSAPLGHVRVKWSRRRDGRLVLRWTETGGPPISEPSRRGFGTGVMERVIGEQLKGEIRFQWRPEGLVCNISLPLSEIDAASER